tara:strand:+ start:3423 stop:6338 length:2916 start_codon:yes stop_codon:yes gene_type:complete
MKDNQITLSKLIIIFLCLLISGCQTFISKEEIEIVEDPWQKLSLDKKIAQMIMFRLKGDITNETTFEYKKFHRWINELGIGGAVVYGGGLEETFNRIQIAQSWSEIPLFIAADYERGLGQWYDGATLFPTNMAVAATGRNVLAYEQGVITAKEAKAFGVNMIFAPVMDVNNNPDNPIINFRSYGDDPRLVSIFGNSFIRGIQEQNVYACVKHFPGHGNTSTDSHTRLPVIPGNRRDFSKIELPPFKSSIKNGVKMVMTAHVITPGIDRSKKPATLSSVITNRLLRKKLKFDGLVVTDAMEMGALNNIKSSEACVRAVEAGADIILLPLDVDSTIHAIKEAVLSGRISEERIDESVERIWLAKEEMNLFSDKGKRDWQKSNLIIGNPKHLNIASKMAQLSITVVKDKNDLLNKISDYKNIAHLSITEDKNSQRYLLPMKNQLNSSYPDLMEIIITEKVNDKKINEIVDKLKNVDLAFISIVVRIRMNKGIATIDPSYAELLKKLHKKGIQFIVTSFGSPYLPDYEYIDTYIAAFGYGSVLVKAAANALLTNNNITGRLPVDLNNQFIRGSQVLVYREESIIDKLDISYSLSVIDSAIEAKVFPGAQVYISKNGNTIISKGFGYHTYHKSKEVTTKTIFDLASITKVVSATPIIMKLVNDKEIYLDQPINDYFPGFHQSGKDTITIRHLLIHESGLSAYHRYFLESKYRGRGEVLDNIINRRLTYKPGSEYKYSDLGMILLGTILERVGGNNLHALGKSWFYSPLGMNNTFYNPPPNVWKDIPPTERTVVPIGTSKNSLRRKIAGIASELIGPMKSLSYDLYPRKTAHGYVHDENANLLGGISAHAGLFSNAEDLGKYSQMLLNDGMIGDKKIIDKELISLFTSRQSTVNEANRGYGWDRPDRDGTSSAGDYFSDKAFGHLGYTGTSFWIDPEQELVVVLLTNRVYPTRNNPGIKQVRRKFHNTLNKSILRFN